MDGRVHVVNVVSETPDDPISGCSSIGRKNPRPKELSDQLSQGLGFVPNCRPLPQSQPRDHSPQKGKWFHLLQRNTVSLSHESDDPSLF